MNELLKKHSPSANKEAGASLLVRKEAVDAELTELARPGVGTIYDREYQTGGNPFANKRPANPNQNDDVVPVAPDSKEVTAELQTEMVGEGGKRHQRHYPMKDNKIMSETTKEEIGDEQGEDWIHHHSSLTAKVHSYDFEQDRNRKIANRVAANRYFKQYVSAENIKTNNDILMVNIPRGKVAQAEFSPTAMLRMERELSTTLNVRAKYAHVVLNAGFDGVCFEFMLV